MPITVQDQKKNKQDTSVSEQNKKSCGIVKHDAPLTAIEVTDFKNLLTEQFSIYHDVIVEFTDLTDCDTLGIQLLLSANKSAKARNSRFEIKGDIEVFNNAAQRIGLDFEEYFNQAAG
ncbi:MAG: STAS domain-containing protein [Desulfamplus sp.]|nr:STAS domain-containing protein [Desulfamplus sp.]